jgi:hypothetical protein
VSEEQSRRGRTNRRKGAAWERALVRRFRGAMPGAEIQRGLQSRGGDEVPDVDTPVFWLEAKHGKRPSVRNALDQARDDCPKGRMPIAVVKDDRKSALVAIELDDFLELVSEWWARRNL